MKLLFITGLYPKEFENQLSESANGLIQRASNVFQWAVVDGLVKNEVDFHVISLPFLPAYPMRFKTLMTPIGDIKTNKLVVGKMLRYCNLFIYKTISMRKILLSYLKKYISDNHLYNDEIIILTYTPYVPFIQSAYEIKKQYTKVRIATIVTDLVDDMMSFKSNRGVLKRIQSEIEKRKTKKLYKHIDKFILLTKPMEEKIPEAIDRSIVIEGIHYNSFEYIPISKNNKIKTLLYTGTFEVFAGLKDLVQAFMFTNNPDFRLVLCGKGNLTNYVLEQAKKDSRIIYKGLVTREEAVVIQQESTVLINPRKPDEGITRFSFPSKTMEYMSSGTPMIGYMLQGIPREYYKHMYIPCDTSITSMVNLINETLLLPQKVLDKKAMDAYNFIKKNKSSKIQVGRIINFIKK